jgi:3-hydroxyphenylacetate 6-hydroxylase
MAISNLASVIQAAVIENPIKTFLFVLVAVPILYIVANESVRRANRVPGLSGPPGLPLIGNLWQIKKNAAEKYREWTKSYGAVYQVQLGNIPIVVVNTAAAAKVLFGQNAQALSSRPEFYTFHKVSNYLLGDNQPRKISSNFSNDGPLLACTNRL